MLRLLLVSLWSGIKSGAATEGLRLLQKASVTLWQALDLLHFYQSPYPCLTIFNHLEQVHARRQGGHGKVRDVIG